MLPLLSEVIGISWRLFQDVVVGDAADVDVVAVTLRSFPVCKLWLHEQTTNYLARKVFTVERQNSATMTLQMKGVRVETRANRQKN